MWIDVDLQHRVIHVHRGRRGAPKSGRLRHVPIFDSVLTVLREMKLAKVRNSRHRDHRNRGIVIAETAAS